ncbi:unnamed protein product [Rhizophagus irregularis]|nr:unnamed protein product [Rhizophagus irregularis]
MTIRCFACYRKLNIFQLSLDQILPNIIMHNVQDKISPESTQRLSYRSYRNSTSSTYSGPNSSKYYYAQMCKIRFLLSPRNVCRIAATVTQLLQLSNIYLSNLS